MNEGQRKTAMVGFVCLVVAVVSLGLYAHPLEELTGKAWSLATRVLHAHIQMPIMRPPYALADFAPTRGRPTLRNGGLINGREYAPTFRPYGRMSPWNLKVSARPKIADYSAAVIAHQFPDNTNTKPVRSNEAGQYDYGHPVFYASNSDPVVNLTCNQYCNRFDNGGAPKRISLPAKARPAGGTDAHMIVIEPNGTEIDMWALYGTPGNDNRYPPHRQSRDWRTGDTASAGNISNCGSVYNGTGMIATGPAATAGGACALGGQITATELLAGKIDHAIFLLGECGIGNVYPAYPGASTAKCSSGVGPPLGGHLWYDVPEAVTNGDPNLRPWEKAILNAMHEFGGYFEDNFKGGDYYTGLNVAIGAISEAGFDFGRVSASGAGDPFAALASQGWYPLTIPDTVTATRWVGADPWRPHGVDWIHHFHWLDACSARSKC